MAAIVTAIVTAVVTVVTAVVTAMVTAVVTALGKSGKLNSKSWYFLKANLKLLGKSREKQ